ncbi:hypothetical protein DQ04_01341090 [Trypanosoma grayi]|uniref:hypothetical protein n=1 Tax=Trypanosoma grayi TaxID=71804 RepID=UPI0004F428AB|nr:hypothetical protein DQ04_01341090 [Trypanosoma grayi]KEG12907.1 hypothetical protein DQ04_01341090 [Trypanosoma grayi]
MTRNYAFVLMNPKCMRGEGEEQVAAYVTDFLQRHKIRVEAGGTVRGIAATLRHMADELQAEVFKYAVKQTPSQYVIDTDAMTEFFNVFGELWDTRRIRNAVEYAIEFNLSASRLKETWDACTPRKRIAPSLYIGKVPDRNVYLVNGFALHSAEAFNMSDTVKRYFLVSWDNTDGDYAHYLQHVIGDPYVEVAEPGSLQRVLLDEWRMAGLQCPPDPFEGAVITSTSALEAMQQRQLWMSLGLSHDAVGRFAMQQLGVSPYVLRWALGNPRSACGDGRYLFDTVRGKGSAAVLRLIIAEDARHRAAPPRNSAFVLVKSHALCRPFAATIETVFARAHVRIDEEGDLSGAIVKGRGLVHHLYATASRYAVRDVATIRLTKEERDSVRRQLGIAWEQLVDSGVVVNAYQALEVLGGVTPLHLYDRWRASKRLLTIRPDLVIAELEERGIFVVNGFFPELKQSLEAANVLLHWYVVSWEEAGMNWPAFLTHVIGDEFPMSAQPQSIRGQLFQRWQEYGLTTEPDMLRNGLHVSEGALQAMRERTKCLHYALPEDYLGDVMLRHGVPERVLRVWLENPDVTSGGVEAGVFEHLRHCDTSRLLVLLTALTDELNQETGGDAARIPVEEGKPHDTLHTTDSDNDDKDTSLQHQGEHQQSERGVVPHQRGGTAPETESTLLHQNTAMILVKPHASDNLKVLALLEEILAANHIRVRQEIRKQSYPRLVDKHLSSAMYYATHNYLHNYPEVTEEGRVQFYEAFNEQWEYAVSSRRVLGAFDALNRFSMTPSQLYVKWSLPQQQHVQLAYDMEVMKFHAEGVYVVNALFPFERERMLQAGPGMRDIHCYVVSWDQRKCSWHQFLQDVIGDVDPANSTETSLRGRLYSGWEEVALPSRPNRVDNIVLASGGPLQAFMERELWCGTGDLAPDPLVRALSLLDHDPTELLEWKENPLVRYTGGTPGGDWVTSRMFSITYELDTKEFVDLISEHEGFFVPISPPCEVEEAQEQLEEEQQARRERIAGGRVGDRYVLQGDSVDSTAARSGTSCEWVRAALLSLGEEDVTRLWSYYGGRTGGDSGGTNSESGDVLTPPVAAAAAASAPASMTGSIDGEAFRRDIEALDFYGLPLARGTVKKLFEGMVHRGDGRTTYEEFRRVLAVLQQM